MIAFLELNKVFVEVSSIHGCLLVDGMRAKSADGACSCCGSSTSSSCIRRSRGRASTTTCFSRATCGCRWRCARPSRKLPEACRGLLGWCFSYPTPEEGHAMECSPRSPVRFPFCEGLLIPAERCSGSACRRVDSSRNLEQLDPPLPSFMQMMQRPGTARNGVGKESCIPIQFSIQSPTIE